MSHNKLEKQINTFSQNMFTSELTQNIQDELYNGTSDEPNISCREKFVEFMLLLDDDPNISSNNGLVPIDMITFLGAEGLKLYKDALEEETKSKAYMNAVFNQSIKYYPGFKWLERPAILITGPSGSGKSCAADAVIGEVSKSLITDSTNQSGNFVITIDGATARIVSQMRKLVIRVANRKGYSGVKDLHTQSAALEEVKQRIQNAALVSDMGMVIPETFSDWLISSTKRNLMPLLQDEAKLIFARIVGEDASLFPKVVEAMGTKRAWLTENTKIPELDLNSMESLPESKEYGGYGFIPGLFGSILAENWFTGNIKSGLSFLITNDLMLKKKNAQNIWEEAQPTDKNYIIVSKRAFNAWNKQPLGEDLDDYVAKNKQPIIIKSSSMVELDKVIRKLSHYISTNNILEDYTGVHTPTADNNVQQAIMQKFIQLGFAKDQVKIIVLERMEVFSKIYCELFNIANPAVLHKQLQTIFIPCAIPIWTKVEIDLFKEIDTALKNIVQQNTNFLYQQDKYKQLIDYLNTENKSHLQPIKLKLLKSLEINGAILSDHALAEHYEQAIKSANEAVKSLRFYSQQQFQPFINILHDNNVPVELLPPLYEANFFGDYFEENPWALGLAIGLIILVIVMVMMVLTSGSSLPLVAALGTALATNIGWVAGAEMLTSILTAVFSLAIALLCVSVPTLITKAYGWYSKKAVEEQDEFAVSSTQPIIQQPPTYRMNEKQPAFFDKNKSALIAKQSDAMELPVSHKTLSNTV